MYSVLAMHHEIARFKDDPVLAMRAPAKDTTERADATRTSVLHHRRCLHC